MLDDPPTIVRLGTVDIINPDDKSSGSTEDVSIVEIIKHPMYRRNYQFHDIALVRLARDVEISTFIYPACVNTYMTFPDAGLPVTVVGWGETDANGK